MGKMTGYENRIRERFAALVRDPLWPTVERLVREDWRDDDENWFPDLQQTCIDLSRRLGLAIGPAICAWCEKPSAEFGDVPDRGPCQRCAAEDAARVARDAEAQRRYDQMSPTEKAEHEATIRLSIGGLIARDVQ